MNENVENMVLEQLRLMREEMRTGFGDIRGQLESLEIKVDGHAALLVALGKCVHDIDARVEHIEEKLGNET